MVFYLDKMKWQYITAFLVHLLIDWLLCTFQDVQLNNLAIFFSKWVRESDITSKSCPLANAVGSQENSKNYGNCHGNHQYHYHLHLSLVFHLFMVDLAIEEQKYLRCNYWNRP